MDVHELYRAEGDDTVVVRVHVQPGAGRSAVVGRHGDALKVRVAAPPEGGRANEACVALLAEAFGTAEAKVKLHSGAKSRSKEFRVSGVDIDEFRRLLRRAAEGALAGQGPEGRPGRR